MHTLEFNFIFFSVYLFVLLFVRKVRLQDKKGELLFISISFFMLAFLHVFVEYDSVEDLPGYESAYKEIARSSSQNIFQITRKGDPLYALINKGFSYLTSDFRFFLLFYNLLLLGSHYYVFNKYSPCLPISILMFLACTYNQSLFVLRQYIAISFLMISIPFLIERKLIPYLLLCICAFLNHSSALLFLPLYFIYGIRSKLLFAIVIIAAVGFVASLNTDIGMYLLLLNIDYEEYLNLDTEPNLTAILIPVSYLTVYVLALRKHIFDEGINRLCLIALVFYAMGYVFAPAVGLIGRIMKYYEVFVMFAVPITIKYMKAPILRVIYLSLVIVLQGYLAISNLSEFYFSDYRIGDVDLGILTMIVLADGLIVLCFALQTKNKNKSAKVKPQKHVAFAGMLR